jgi:hypothetical protein
LKYLSINYSTSYHKLFWKRKDGKILVFERTYDEITSNVGLTTRKRD